MRLQPFAFALAAFTSVTAASAQSVCKPKSSTSESKLLAFYAGPLAFAFTPEVVARDRGSITVAGDLTLVPTPPSAIQKSSGACGFNKSENSELAPVFPRPRVALGLGQGIAIEASYLPPLTVADATPNLAAVAVSWAPSIGALPASVRAVFRAHATLGGVRGPVTCAKSALQQTSPNLSCYGSKPSDDEYNPNVRGVEAALMRTVGSWRWYGGAGLNALGTKFTVDFTDLRGFEDRNVVEVSLMRTAVFGGAEWAIRSDLSFSGQVYSVPGDATTGRLGLAWRAR
jgi:hypothetical protein